MKIIQDWYKRAGRKRVVLPWWYRFAYADHCRACDIYYPIPINYIVRWWEKVYWWPQYALWWVGFYDTPDDVELSLSDFWRIKSH